LKHISFDPEESVWIISQVLMSICNPIEECEIVVLRCYEVVTVAISFHVV